MNDLKTQICSHFQNFNQYQIKLYNSLHFLRQLSLQIIKHINPPKQKYFLKKMQFQLQSVLQVLLSSDNQRRIQAEQYINTLTTTNYQNAIDAFLNAMNNLDINIASMSALLLKKKYLDTKDQIKQLSQEQFQKIIIHVENVMLMDRSVIFLRRCCQIIVRIYTYCEKQKQLINVINNLSSIQSINIKLTLMYLIEIICQFTFNDTLLMQFSTTFQNIFTIGLENINNQVRVATFKTLTVFLSSINDEKLMKKFNNVLSTLLEKTIQLIKYDQQTGIVALESLNQLIQSHPKFIKPIINNIFMIYKEIMQSHQLLVNLRITAMHGVLLICMNHSSLVRKNQFFKSQMVKTYMKMLSQNQNMGLEQWASQLNDEIISKNDISLSTQEHLVQLLNQLGNKFMLPLFINHIQQYLSQPEPCYQHSGLAAIAILTQNCHESFKKQLKNIIALIIPLLSTQNPKLMNYILIAMGYFCQEFAPEIYQNYGNMILQFICHCLKHPVLKVQYKAVQCLQNFQKGLEQHKEQAKIIIPYINSILSELGRIFQHGLANLNYLLLEATLDSISAIASMNSFVDYYPSFMPGLKKIISMIGNDSPQKVMIRSKTVETMGYLLASVKDHEQLFKPDCQQIMNSLIYMSNMIDKDDTLHRAMFVVYENVAECLKTNFIKYSDSIFEKAIEAVNRKVQFKIIDETETQKPINNPNMNKYVKMKVDLKIDGVKNLVLNTDSLEQKLQASNLLSIMAEQMGVNFVKYIQKMMVTVAELISFKNSKQIRNNMIQICKFMVIDCPTIEQKQAVLNYIFQPMSQQLSTTIRTKNHVQTCALVEVLSQLTPYMSIEMVNRLPEMLSTVIVMVKSLVNQVQKIYAQKQIDDDLNQQMNQQTSEIEQVLQYIETIINLQPNNTSFQNLKKIFPIDYQFGI